MATTPPPPTRVRTPPTPLHGPKYDSFDAYSPRRSSRINSKRDQSVLQGHVNRPIARIPRPQPGPGEHVKQQMSTSATTLTPRKKPTIKRTSSQHISPPSSPISPPEDTNTPVRRRRNMSSRFEIANDQSPHEIDSDFDMAKRPASAMNGNRPSLPAMLPTPAKTPKKRGLHDEVQLKSTARVLFPSRPATVEEAMPSPRKSKKGRYAELALDSLDEDKQVDEKILIYTDSKERIPEEDEGEDNPFLARRRGRKTAPTPESLTVKRTRTTTKHGMTKEVDEAVERGEGMVYVFRGKKMFRKFDDANDNAVKEGDEDGDGEEEDGTALHDTELGHRVGEPVRKPLTRTSLKPRLLFPPKITTPDSDDVDEEAITDIEGPAPASDAEQLTTPVKRTFQPPTPPTTSRKRKSYHATSTEAPLGNAQDFSMGLDGINDYLRLPQLGAGRRRASPFDSSRHVKPGNKSGEAGSARAVSAKRQGEALERGGGLGNIEAAGKRGGDAVAKRSRSGPA